MKVVDISGPIYEGMWDYPEPMGTLLKGFQLSSLEFEHGGERYALEVFDNMKAQTGTYLESPGRYLESNRYTVSDIPIERLYMMEAYVLSVPYEKMAKKDGKRFLSVEDVERAIPKNARINKGAAILIGTGYGKQWKDDDFFDNSWFFRREAMECILAMKPFLLGADSAEWESPKNPEGIFKIFFPANVLILAPCINLDTIHSFHVTLTVLPLKVWGAYICPVRAVVCE
jgi:kynurenine formamidase